MEIEISLAVSARMQRIAGADDQSLRGKKRRLYIDPLVDQLFGEHLSTAAIAGSASGLMLTYHWSVRYGSTTA